LVCCEIRGSDELIADSSWLIAESADLSYS
jgi:hypothetical protein